jgi:hypothetical protein
MIYNFVFIGVIFLCVFTGVGLCFRTYFNTIYGNRISKTNLYLLQKTILVEQNKYHLVHEKNLLADNLNKSMMNNFTRITIELISTLKLSLN